jgi:2-phosphoglycerate kinase
MRSRHDRLGWRVLLIGGPSGAGKSTAAARLGRRLGLPWLQVDDLRLALQWSGAVLPAGTGALAFFESPAVWRQPPARLRDALIAVGQVMSPAIEKVVDNHVHIKAPIIIEGDGILPGIVERAVVREHAAEGLVRAVFVVEEDEAALLANMRARGRGIDERDDESLRVEARAKWLYGQWLVAEARRRRLPVVAARPWGSLTRRLLAAGGAAAGTEPPAH